MDLDVAGVEQSVNTGAVPPNPLIDDLLARAYERAERHHEGAVADYIPILAEADAEAFGLCVADVDGGLHELGDTRTEFSIQSISKAFVYALLCEALGHERVFDVVGVNNTGLAFNSVVAIELNDGHPMNPMVNAGAIATTALMPGGTANLSDFGVSPTDVSTAIVTYGLVVAALVMIGAKIGQRVGWI